MPIRIPRPHLAKKMAKKRKVIVIRKLDCLWLNVEASERKGKYEDDENFRKPLIT